MVEFNNGNSVNSIPSNQNNRGVRSNFYACECFDLETDSVDTVVVWLDWREPFGRFVPVWYFEKYMNGDDLNSKEML